MKKLRSFLLILFSLSCLDHAHATGEEKFLIVTKPVVDLRKEPVDARGAYAHDDLQETQALYNEVLRYEAENKDWYKVEAPEQREFSQLGRWQGYEGWVRKTSVTFLPRIPKYNSVVSKKTAKIYYAPGRPEKGFLTVSIGTRLKTTGEDGEHYKVDLADGKTAWILKTDLIGIEKVTKEELRKNIISTAKLFLGVPYLWGGRSMLMPEPGPAVTGVDCSGLVSLVYRANNIDIPRDAHEEWMVAEKIPQKELKSADLVFVSAKNKFNKIVHVMLFAGGETLLESPETGGVVRVVTFKEKFGKTRAELAKQGFIAGGKKVYFGRIVK
ncbi:MAG: NlpC/P60 family protein [Candidatus Omnitrophica bacterium]|nr:NlpC/P60 family protein [Candidatus Omnitrophota bacterium]